MDNIQLCISDQFLLLADSNGIQVPVVRVDTVNRSYLIGCDKGGDAPSAGEPTLDVIGVRVDGSENGDLIRLRGFVSGHPRFKDNGQIMNTSLVTAFHLQNGDVVRTSYGLRSQSCQAGPKVADIWDVGAHTPV